MDVFAHINFQRWCTDSSGGLDYAPHAGAALWVDSGLLSVERSLNS
jgi:hypothetical protein